MAIFSSGFPVPWRPEALEASGTPSLGEVQSGAARIPSPACWGRWREAPDGVWPAATTPDGLHERFRELAAQAPCLPHPIRRLRRHLPRFAEKGGPSGRSAKTKAALQA